MRRAIPVLTALLAASLAGRTLAEAAGERGSVTFERDVEPILTRAGCNAGACHGKARGQNGFPLSLLGFDPDFDHDGDRQGGPRPPGLPGGPRAEPAAPQGDGAGAARRRPAAGAGHARSTRRSPLDRRRDAPHAGRRAEAGADRRRADRAHLEAAASRSRSASRPTSPTARPRT